MVLRGFIHGTLYLLEGSTVSANGLEFCSSEFNQFCKDATTTKHLTVRDTPQKNGVAERMNQILYERARCILSNASLEKRFWAESDGFDKQVELREIQSDYPGSIDGRRSAKVF